MTALRNALVKVGVAAPARRAVTPLHPSRTATARVTNKLPVPTVCCHCGSAVELRSNACIYGREYGDWPWVYQCADEHDGCGAYVGLHPFTAIPVGTLATAAIRAARQRAKAAFNPLWQGGGLTRSAAYAWLAYQLGISVAECHIGWSDAAQCQRIIEACERKPRRP